ncbi:MAG: cytochrome b/b6 domain-containing protein [Frankiaceae bacterium]
MSVDGVLSRFSRGERWVHRATGILMGLCLLTAAVLYIGPLSILVGRRPLIRTIHVYAGLALPVPALLGLGSAAFRADLRRLNRFLPSDWAWLRDRQRRSGRIAVGKFNAGQKLNASFIAGAMLVMLGTGLIMRYGAGGPLSLRTGATLVHDWLAYAVAAMVIGHLWFAARDPIARDGMRTGDVPASWALREHGAWARAEAADQPRTVNPRNSAE